MMITVFKPPFDALPGLSSLPERDGKGLALQEVDSHLRRERDGLTEAVCSLWWRKAPAQREGRLGCIGHFQATHSEAGKEILLEALNILTKAGCHRAVGPMDGNTWRAHRLVTWSSGESSFFLEPANPSWYSRCFEETGFQPWARYSSSLLPLQAVEESEALRHVRDRLEQQGLRITSLRRESFEHALHHIYKLSLQSFADNFLYTPISKAAFISMYRRIEPLLNPELVLFAWQAETLVGFVFTFPDPRLERTLIVKTLAVAPERRLAGLGSYLIHEVQSRAADRGFTRAIHALQHEENTSLKITERHGGTRMREYTLYHRLLSP